MQSLPRRRRSLWRRVAKTVWLVPVWLAALWSGLTLAADPVADPVAGPVADSAACNKPLYLTLDTGNMRFAQMIGELLERNRIPATFFLANEVTWPDRTGHALDPQWRGFWQRMARAGHAFGSHTWRHGQIRSDAKDQAVRYRPQFGANAGRDLVLQPAQFCDELNQVDQAFRTMTGRGLDPIWRAPGGRVTTNSLAVAAQCGYAHVHWAKAGFLGDELPSDTYPNALLHRRALAAIKAGDILMAHLGIWSRQDPFAPTLEKLLLALKSRGFCFATLRDHPQYRDRPGWVGQ
jgi:peptidoglycan/xylan/chitin deacetylase (PgdA/CDA1 family)